MSTHNINVRLQGNDIIVNPEKLVLKGAQGKTTLVWIPSGNGPGEDVVVEKIRFDSPQAPFENGEQTTGGRYAGTWDTDVTSTTWKYSIRVSRNGNLLPWLDPEIQNGPPGGEEGDEEDPPGGGG